MSHAATQLRAVFLPAVFLALAAPFVFAGPDSVPPVLSPGESSPREAAEAPIFAVLGGTLIDGTGAAPIPDSAIIFEGDRIRAAGRRRQIRIPPGAIAVDATDLTVIPGLIDMHVHLFAGTDLSLFLERGVTSVRNLGDVPLEEIVALRRDIDEGRVRGPRLFHCGLFVVSEPPLKEEIYPPDDLKRFMIMRSPADARGVVRRLVDAGADVVKVKTEMSVESLRALGAAAAEAGLPMTFDNGGETGSYDALAAFDAGARGVEHLSGIPFDEPATVEAVLKKMLAVGAYADPTLVVLDRTYARSRVEAREEFLRRFVAAGGSVIAGTDFPTRGLTAGISLHQELERLVGAGLSNKQALEAATGRAGRALGYPGLVGTIEAGAFADFLIIAGDPLKEIRNADRILRVFKGGIEFAPECNEAVTEPAPPSP